jgi:uncharacterized membrane protein YfcA
VTTAVVGALLGIVAGSMLGLTGAGGSVLAVPLLMVGYGWALSEAAPVALIAVAASAVLGTVLAWRHSYVRYRAAALMGLGGWLSAPFGLRLARHLPESLLVALFAMVMVIVAVRMIRQALRRPDEAQVMRAGVSGDGPPASGHLIRLDPATGRLIWTPVTALVIGSLGGVTGFLSGLLGVGGGFVIVPALRIATPLSIHSAVATSLMTIAVVASGAVAAAALAGPGLPWMQTLPFAAGSLIGMGMGRWITPRVSGARLEEAFAGLMLVVAIGMAGRAAKFW